MKAQKPMTTYLTAGSKSCLSIAMIAGKTKVEAWCRKMKKQTNEYKRGIISSSS
ncbi:hypothetical protein [Bacteroides difficilis]|uniref:Transposase n=1 Tax=Bacteroides difficilis TaxID=2763021 RepID=A0ABR7CCX7_9BACE|nr:hypothetical protein [Bacteroides difficilis]MBC5605640.1 hypothetical protein [Bacteroides difficilis]